MFKLLFRILAVAAAVAAAAAALLWADRSAQSDYIEIYSDDDDDGEF